MSVRFELLLDDLLAFYRYYYANSTTVRNQKCFVIAIATVTAFGLSLVFELGLGLATRLALATVFSVAFGLFFHLQHGSALESQAKKMIAEGSVSGMLCAHEMTIEENGLFEKTDVNESRHTWSAIDRVVETPDHAFIFISSIQAHIIPKHQIASGDYDAFMREVRKRVPSSTPATSQ